MAKYTKLVKLTYSIISRLHNIGVIHTALFREDNYFILFGDITPLLDPSRVKASDVTFANNSN